LHLPHLILNLKERKNYILPLHIDNSRRDIGHWFSCVILKLNNEYHVYYADSITPTNMYNIYKITNFLIGVNIKNVAKIILSILQTYITDIKYNNGNNIKMLEYVNGLITSLKKISLIAQNQV